jgi:hypothetical protein
VTGLFSWVDLAALVISVASLGVTIAIFFLGRRLSFRQQRERVRELEAKAWEVLGPIRTEGLNRKIIVMNVARYKRGYDGSNNMTWRGYAYTGPEFIEIVHGGVEVISKVTSSYYGAGERRCPCRKLHPCSSGGMLVFMQDAAESIASADVESDDLVHVGDQLGQRV